MRKTFAKKLMGLTMSVMLTAFAAVPFTAHAASDVTVNWNDVKQEIDGFGVSQAGWSDAIYDLQEPVRSEIMDLLFKPDTGIGISIFRGALFPQFNPAPGQYDFNARPDQVWVMQQAKARGVDKLIASTWSPPAWMKTNNSTTHGGVPEAGKLRRLRAAHVQIHQRIQTAVRS
ncbi:glycoside hydrolase [Paenibacillus sp. JTLBN-2024]